ncbi:hypothetical protein [Kamptonema formosum]|uniref:hypothetical protein n=1 Tax=Kamptonema formosum TaxID=331992 RepID=UPI00034C4E6A|nr:hypothetical protein [Oscillatoria sp. PCC 10802]
MPAPSILVLVKILFPGKCRPCQQPDGSSECGKKGVLLELSREKFAAWRAERTL